MKENGETIFAGYILPKDWEVERKEFNTSYQVMGLPNGWGDQKGHAFNQGVYNIEYGLLLLIIVGMLNSSWNEWSFRKSPSFSNDYRLSVAYVQQVKI